MTPALTDAVVKTLGPVVIARDGMELALGAKPRLLLALLAAHPGRSGSVDRLCESLWGDDQPTTAVATLQSHLSAPSADAVSGWPRGGRGRVPAP